MVAGAADGADGADGAVGSALAHGRYPDGPGSPPPLAAEHNLNPKRAKRGLCPTQPASECPGTPWPARPNPSGPSIAANIHADPQKVGCASRPLRSVGHELAHIGRYGVGVDDVLDRVAPVIIISGFKGTRGSKCALAGCGPEREISHARQAPEAYMRQHAYSMRGRIEERAKNMRSGELELPPKRSLRPVLSFGNWSEHQQDSAVRKIGTSNDLLDPVENDGSGGCKQNFVLIGEQPTGRKSTAARQTAEGVRQPRRQAAEIVEGEDVAIAGSDEQLPVI